MTKKYPTKKQHYIPQVYLKGFSQDSSTIYEYNYKKGEAIQVPVSIESVCRKKDLYEVRENNGEIINPNYIEDILCEYEGLFAKYREQLLRKAHIKENYNKLILSKDEKDFWRVYTTLHIMRNPETLSRIETLFHEDFEGQFTEIDNRNLAVAYCLPFFKKLEKNEKNAFTIYLSVLLTRTIMIGFAESDNMFTSDHAMYGSGTFKDNDYGFGRLWFPVSSNCAIIFYDPKLVGKYNNNRLIPISEDEVYEMNEGIAYIAKQMVFSKYPFSESDIRLIKEARKKRAEDDANEKANINKFGLFNMR